MTQLEMPTIKTKRLWLRPLELADAIELLDVYQDERVMLGNAGVKPIPSIQGMLKFLQYGFLAYQEWGIPQAMVLEREVDCKVIGIVEYHTLREDIGELGYLLAYAHWNQGYMQEALEAMVYLGFTHLNLHRIEARCDVSNLASANVLVKNGFTKEGVLRKAMMLNDDVHHDLTLYSILKEEYDEKKHESNLQFINEQEDVLI